METFYLILLGLAGVLLHIGFKFRDYITKMQNDPVKRSFKELWDNFEWLGVLLPAAFSVLIVVVLILVRDEIAVFFSITILSAIFLGYIADSVFKNLEGYFIKKFQVK